MTPHYQMCVRCVMDTSDPEIAFNAAGVCSHCQDYETRIAPQFLSASDAAAHRDRIVKEIRAEGKDKPYDCVIGVSGGVDSTYVAFAAKQLGLRPLAVHLDNGWNSELAVKNIENVLRRLSIDLHTVVLDWEEFRDIQRSFLRASVPDCEIPTDHAIVAVLYETAKRVGARHILSGCNVRTESHLPRAWSQGHGDWRYIRSVHKQFGSIPLRTFPHRGFWTIRRQARAFRWIDILDYLDYVKASAMETLTREVGWQAYGGKHYESIYTRFYQGYILPTKFGFDKRRAHLSSLISSNQISRDEALAELNQSAYDPDLLALDRAFVVKKLGMTDQEFQAIMQADPRTFWDYPSYARIMVSTPYRALQRWRGIAALPGPPVKVVDEQARRAAAVAEV